MRTQFALFAVVAALFAFVSFGAEAMPAASLASVSNSQQATTQVADRCGRGYHRNRFGRCRRN